MKLVCKHYSKSTTMVIVIIITSRRNERILGEAALSSVEQNNNYSVSLIPQPAWRFCLKCFYLAVVFESVNIRRRQQPPENLHIPPPPSL